VSVLLRPSTREGDLARLPSVRQNQDHDQHDDAEEIAQNSEEDRVVALALSDLRAGISEHKGQGEDEKKDEDFDDSNLSSPASAINGGTPPCSPATSPAQYPAAARGAA
jgi:hypothetical protein